MLRRLAPTVIMVTALLGAADAKATIVSGAFLGGINYGRAYAGVFGAANASLDGLRYTGSFTYDTSKGLRFTTDLRRPEPTANWLAREVGGV